MKLVANIHPSYECERGGSVNGGRVTVICVQVCECYRAGVHLDGVVSRLHQLLVVTSASNSLCNA